MRSGEEGDAQSEGEINFKRPHSTSGISTSRCGLERRLMRHDEESVDAGNKAKSKKARVEREKKRRRRRSSNKRFTVKSVAGRWHNRIILLTS